MIILCDALWAHMHIYPVIIFFIKSKHFILFVEYLFYDVILVKFDIITGDDVFKIVIVIDFKILSRNII